MTSAESAAGAPATWVGEGEEPDEMRKEGRWEEDGVMCGGKKSGKEHEQGAETKSVTDRETKVEVFTTGKQQSPETATRNTTRQVRWTWRKIRPAPQTVHQSHYATTMTSHSVRYLCYRGISGPNQNNISDNKTK